MEILETRVYRGPNLYALWPMIRLKVDLGELEEYPTVKLPGIRRPAARADPDPGRAHLRPGVSLAASSSG